jgi:hypothetical protein
MDRQARDEIVWGLADRFEVERDPVRRHALRTLLIEEEDRFGETAERLDRAEAHIALSTFRIDELESAIARHRARGADVRTAERVLVSMKDMLHIFDRYRDTLLQDLDRRI